MEPNEPHEIELGRATLALAALLDREMDAIFKDILGDDYPNAQALERRRAETANRIVCICRTLAEEVRRYEHLRGLVDAGDEIDDDDDLGF